MRNLWYKSIEQGVAWRQLRENDNSQLINAKVKGHQMEIPDRRLKAYRSDLHTV